jgi:hypothetical protein
MNILRPVLLKFGYLHRWTVLYSLFNCLGSITSIFVLLLRLKAVLIHLILTPMIWGEAHADVDDNFFAIR